MVSSESGRCSAAMCYVSSGFGESSNDIVYSGHALIAENGIILKESQRLARGPEMIIADIDVDRLQHDRRTLTSFQETGKGITEPDIIISKPMIPPCTVLSALSTLTHSYRPIFPVAPKGAMKYSRCR